MPEHFPCTRHYSKQFIWIKLLILTTSLWGEHSYLPIFVANWSIKTYPKSNSWEEGHLGSMYKCSGSESASLTFKPWSFYNNICHNYVCQVVICESLEIMHVIDLLAIFLTHHLFLCPGPLHMCILSLKLTNLPSDFTHTDILGRQEIGGGPWLSGPGLQKWLNCGHLEPNPTRKTLGPRAGHVP